MSPRNWLFALSVSLLLALVVAQPALARTAPAQPAATLGVSLNYAPSTLNVNTDTTGTYSISGGTPPFTISMSGAPPGCMPQPNPFTTSNASGSFTCRPTASGTFNINVNVNDNVGNSGSASATLVVNGNSGGGGSGGNNTGGIDLSFLQNLLPIVMITGILFLGSIVAIAVSLVALAVLVPRRLKQLRKAIEAQAAPKADAPKVPAPPPEPALKDEL